MSKGDNKSMEEQENESEEFLRDEETASVTIAFDNGNDIPNFPKFRIENSTLDPNSNSDESKSARMGSAISRRALVPLSSNGPQSLLNSKVFVPHIPGISQKNLVKLFEAKCKDLKIPASKDQMVRFFEVFSRNQYFGKSSGRKLNLADCGIGDYSMDIICKIIKRNTHFSQLVRLNYC